MTRESKLEHRLLFQLLCSPPSISLWGSSTQLRISVCFCQGPFVSRCPAPHTSGSLHPCYLPAVFETIFQGICPRAICSLLLLLADRTIYWHFVAQRVQEGLCIASDTPIFAYFMDPGRHLKQIQGEICFSIPTTSKPGRGFF